jgi:asparagine synthase (glutamine-hydrolysing)
VCGICGTYQFGSGEPADDGVIGQMLAAIEHRGPDDEGVYRAGEVTLGMRRLSIIDLAGGHQPISNEDGSVVLVFNGEIYNYRELTEQLRQRGHTFATASDTEVVVHLYEEYGDDCVQHLRGMFAFAVWDVRRRRLLLARDRLGIKPLYYTVAGGRLIFGSEIKAILQDPAVEIRPDLQALGSLLSLKYVPAPQTMFAGVQALPPGFVLTCDQEGPKTRAYWDVSFARAANGTGSRRLSDAAYAEQLDGLLREAVRMHLVSDVPFGAFLSGGLDSSTIVALMSQYLDEPVQTFSVGFEGDGVGYSELPFARQVAAQYNTNHREVLVGPRDLIDQAATVVWHLDQPIGDEACLANYLVAKLAARHVKMVLTGEGGDELFAGYARYLGERFSPLVRQIPAPVRSAALAASARIPGLRRPKLALYALAQHDEVTRLSQWFPLFNQEQKAALLSDDLRQALNGSSAAGVFAEHLARTDARDTLSRMLYVDTKLWLVDDLLARGDKTAMAASIEARVPLLDHKLVEFAASLPPDLKIRGLTRKYLLKKVARAYLPASIVDRKKQGFPMPMSIWFRREARDFLRDILSPAAIRSRGLFDGAYVETLLREHETGFADHGSLLWALLSVELWYRQFIDVAPRPRALAGAAKA